MTFLWQVARGDARDVWDAGGEVLFKGYLAVEGMVVKARNEVLGCN